ncbi:MAG: hypothetical protein C9356_11780 [Oleiphilus sp.]|nr:MAG: hypothetical protein C9356_11780 [Oleiphilus sp.]
MMSVQMLIDPKILEQAVNTNVPSWCKRKHSRIVWVNWRKNTTQIKLSWNDSEAFEVYVDFKADTKAQSGRNRDEVLKKLFKLFAPPGKEPFRDRWGHLNYHFCTARFITPNHVGEIADALGYEYTVIYRVYGDQDYMKAIGLPIVAGETGKEWIKGKYHSYAPERGKNL